MSGFAIMWLIFAILFLILEISTVSLVSIWFVAGSVLAFLVALFHLSLGVQIVVFILGTTLLLVFTKPAVQKMLCKNLEATNYDRIIGKNGIVTQKINPTEGTGQIKVSGSIWSAKSEDGSEIDRDKTVEVISVEGVKAVVKQK